ncbi:MAG: hypothetical protein AB7H96_03210 [Vicinamibacterales bacterium]
MSMNLQPDALDRSRAREHIAVAVGVALLVAGIALVVAVLPAEYGVDPTGLGRRFGLLALSDVKQQVASFEQAQEGAVASRTVVGSERPFHQETVSFALAPREFVEYKYRLDKGASLLYSWESTGPVNLEFHAEPDGAPKGYAETYEKQAGIQRSSGTLVTPFAGIHGWYWENTTDAPITVTLTSAGFYSVAHEFRRDAAPATRLFQ